MTFDPTRPVRLRNGSPARIVATINAEPWHGRTKPLVVIHTSREGFEEVHCHRADGGFSYRADEPSTLDLVNEPLLADKSKAETNELRARADRQLAEAVKRRPPPPLHPIIGRIRPKA